jgi:CheY-like chemotaxis protein
MHRVLLIDDDELVRRALTALLEHAGYEVQPASDADSGLRLFREQGADLVLTDLQMPDRGGIEVVLAVRYGPRPVPVIAMSGSDEPRGLEALRDAAMVGAVAFLRKPFTGEELAAAVRAALEAGRS